MSHCKFCSSIQLGANGSLLRRDYPNPGCPGCGDETHIAEVEAIGPGTPLARLRGVAEFAAAHCGHSPVSSTSPEMAVLARIAELEAHLAAVVGAAQEYAVINYGNRYDAKSRLLKLLSSPPIATLLARQEAERRVIEAATWLIHRPAGIEDREDCIAKIHEAVDALAALKEQP